MKSKESIKYLLLILCVLVLFIIPWAFVFGVKNVALKEEISVFQRMMGFLILTLIIITVVYKIYGKSLKQEMKEEEIKEANQKDNKQLQFKPTFGVIIFFLFIIILSIWTIIDQVLLGGNVDSFYIIVPPFLIVFFLWMWYTTPVFIFAEDSVQIKSFLFYILGIDRKTIIKYEDISSVRPVAKVKSSQFRRYLIGISVRGSIKKYNLAFFNSDIIAKIYLRFKEKMSDGVKF
jgi:hypothetical protein